MNNYAAVELALIAVVATTLLAILFSPRRKPKPAEYGRDDGQADVQPDLDEPFQ